MPSESQTNGGDHQLPVPDWLNQAFLERAYGEHLGEVAIIVSFTIAAATGKGENYASSMFRVKSIYSTQKKKNQPLDCIVKVPYITGFAAEILTQLDVYQKELVIYDSVLPEMKLLLAHGGIDAEFVANSIYVSHTHKAIVFEDLSLRGFRMPARSDGLDMDHTRILLEKLALFHGACAVLRERDENIFQHFEHGMLNRNDAAFDTFYLTSLDALTKQISTWPHFEGYAAKLRRLRPDLLERGRRAFDQRPGQFNTLIHGDMWVNNSMFTYDGNGGGGGRPDRMMLVDFQFCCWASPTVDLHYFFNTSLREELRLHGQDELLQCYHSTLVDTLARLKFRGAIPTLHTFHLEFMQSAFYGFISACLVQPIMLNEQTEDADIEALHGWDSRALRFKAMIYTNPKVQSNLRALLPVLDRRGLLD